MNPGSTVNLSWCILIKKKNEAKKQKQTKRILRSDQLEIVVSPYVACQISFCCVY